MRISGYDPSQNIRPEHSVQGNGAVSRSETVNGRDHVKTPGSTDRVELSARARDLQHAREVVEATPEIREERVTAAQQALENGTLPLQGAVLADKLLSDPLHGVTSAGV